MLEKKIINQDFIRWSGNIPVSYVYTAGLAGERFFRELRDKERLIGTACSKCRTVYLPPRLYCERCFKELQKWKAIPKKGMVHTYTQSYLDLDGNQLPIPVTVAFITFKGVSGGLIHKLDEVHPEELKIGLKVTPVFEDKKTRAGSILDIKYFRPV